MIVLDTDDFSPLNHRFDMLDKLKDRYPDFKITMFTVPWEIRLSPDDKGTPITDSKYDGWFYAVKAWIDKGWMEIAIHGLTHAPREFEKLTYDEAQKRILVAQKMFQNRGIPYCPLFKAPQWLISEEAKLAVRDMGMFLVEDGYYNWNLKDPMPKNRTRLIAHGHVQNEPSTRNGLEESFIRLCKIPSNAKWKFLSEVL